MITGAAKCACEAVGENEIDIFRQITPADFYACDRSIHANGAGTVKANAPAGAPRGRRLATGYASPQKTSQPVSLFQLVA